MVKWDHNTAGLLAGYTGPLMVAADVNPENAANNVILVGQAFAYSGRATQGMTRVRMAMTPEEALDLAQSLTRLAKLAIKPRK